MIYAKPILQKEIACLVSVVKNQVQILIVYININTWLRIKKKHFIMTVDLGECLSRES